jgi:hypothetical protein
MFTTTCSCLYILVVKMLRILTNTPPSLEQCTKRTLLTFTSGISNIVTNTLVLAVPVPLLVRANLTLRQRIGVSVLYFFGGNSKTAIHKLASELNLLISMCSIRDRRLRPPLHNPAPRRLRPASHRLVSDRSLPSHNPSLRPHVRQAAHHPTNRSARVRKSHRHHAVCRNAHVPHWAHDLREIAARVLREPVTQIVKYAASPAAAYVPTCAVYHVREASVQRREGGVVVLQVHREGTDHGSAEHWWVCAGGEPWEH